MKLENLKDVVVMKISEITYQELETFKNRNDVWLIAIMGEESYKELISEIAKRFNRLAYRVRHEAIED